MREVKELNTLAESPWFGLKSLTAASKTGRSQLASLARAWRAAKLQVARAVEIVSQSQGDRYVECASYGGVLIFWLLLSTFPTLSLSGSIIL